MKRFALISVLFLLGHLVPAYAQLLEEDIILGDTVLVSKVDSSALLRHRVKARDYSTYALQKRYHPTDSLVPAGSIFNGMFLWGYGSYYHPLTQYYAYGPYAMAGIGKWFSGKDGLRRYHGVRAGLGAGFFMDMYDADRIKTADVRASYMFDLSAYVSGYTPRLICSFVPIAGAGLTFMEGRDVNGRRNMGMSLHAGADFVLHALPGIDIVFEPMYEIQQDARKLARDDFWRKYYPVFRGNVGLNLNLDRQYWKLIGDPGKDWRISVADGVNIPIISGGQLNGVSGLSGNSFEIGLARQYSDLLHLRIQSGYSSYHWLLNDSGVSSRKRASEWHFRLDAMMDILSVLPGWQQGQAWSFMALGGPEIGILHKDDLKNVNVFPYVGLGAGIQLRYELIKDFALFAEQRARIIPYTTSSVSGEQQYDSYYDLLASAYLGLEYRLRPNIHSGNSSFFSFDGWYATAYGSGYYPLSATYSGGPMLFLGITKWQDKRSALRFGASAGYYYSSFNDIKVKDAGLHGYYLYNLMSDESPLRLSTVLGLGVGRVWNSYGYSTLTPAAHTGLSFWMPVLKGVSLIVEPVLDFQPDLFSRKNGQGFDFLSSFRDNVGVEIALGREGRSGVDPGLDWRVSVGGGVYSIGSELISQAGFASSLGRGVSFGLSRKMNGWFDWRVRPSYYDCYWGTDSKALRARYVTMALDAMFDVRRLRREPVTAPWLSLSLFAGPEVGVFTKSVSGMSREPFVGAGAGIQAKASLGSRISLYTESRALFVPYRRPEGTPISSYINSLDIPFGALLGVEYKLERDESGGLDLRSLFSPEGWYATAYGSGYYPLTSLYSSGPMLMVGVTKWQDNRHGLRLVGGAGYYMSNTRAYHVKDIGIRGTYLHNMLPSDMPFRLSTAVGAGLERNWDSSGVVSWTAAAHGGVSFLMPVMDGVNILVEPMLDVQPDMYKRRGGQGIDLLFSIRDNVGVEIALGREGRRGVDPGLDWRVSVGGGVYSIGSELISQAGFASSLGRGVSFGLSRKMNGWFDWRVRPSYYDCYWGTDSKALRARYVTMALDAMFDVRRLRREPVTAPWLSLSLFAGPEVGVFTKSVSGMSREPFVGAGAGIQAKAYLGSRISLYTESRALFVPYRRPEGTPISSYINSLDIPFGALLGVEYKLEH